MPYYPEKKPETSGEKQTKRTEKQIRLLRLFVAVFSCLLILYGSIRLILYYADLSASRNTARELQQIHNQKDPETEYNSQTPESTALPFISPTYENREDAIRTLDMNFLMIIRSVDANSFADKTSHFLSLQAERIPWVHYK